MTARFLAWLDERGLSLGAATQPDVDLWLSQGSTNAYRLRDFLRWAHARGLAADLYVPWRARDGLAEHVLAEDWRLPRRCLREDTLPLRVAGALVLIYGQIPARIVELTQDHLTTTGADTCLTLGRQPVLPPTLAILVTELGEHSASSRRPSSSGRALRPWSFPGTRPDAHLESARLVELLNEKIGIFTRPACGGALCALAGELPAQVLADLLGPGVSTAIRWGALAGREHAVYLAARAANPGPTAERSSTATSTTVPTPSLPSPVTARKGRGGNDGSHHRKFTDSARNARTRSITRGRAARPDRTTAADPSSRTTVACLARRPCRDRPVHGEMLCVRASMFFSSGGERDTIRIQREIRAKQICQTCPVRIATMAPACSPSLGST